MLQTYLPLSPDLPTIVSRFTYRCLWMYLTLSWIYLLLSPDLPTIISKFTYCRLRIYLPLSLDLPTIASRITYPWDEKSGDENAGMKPWGWSVMQPYLDRMKSEHIKKILFPVLNWQSLLALPFLPRFSQCTMHICKYQIGSYKGVLLSTFPALAMLLPNLSLWKIFHNFPNFGGTETTQSCWCLPLRIEEWNWTI